MGINDNDKISNENINKYVNIYKNEINDEIVNNNIDFSKIKDYIKNININKKLINKYKNEIILNNSTEYCQKYINDLLSGDEEYDIKEFLLMVSQLPKKEQEIYLDAYERYISCTKLKDKKISLIKAEKLLYGSINLTNAEVVQKVVDSYFIKLKETKEGLTKFNVLLNRIKSISSSEMSTKTKYDLIKYEVALFGIENGLDCYLFSSNLKVFDDLYSKVMIRKGLSK